MFAQHCPAPPRPAQAIPASRPAGFLCASPAACGPCGPCGRSEGVPTAAGGQGPWQGQARRTARRRSKKAAAGPSAGAGRRWPTRCRRPSAKSQGAAQCRAVPGHPISLRHTHSPRRARPPCITSAPFYEWQKGPAPPRAVPSHFPTQFHLPAFCFTSRGRGLGLAMGAGTGQRGPPRRPRRPRPTPPVPPRGPCCTKEGATIGEKMIRGRNVTERRADQQRQPRRRQQRG